MHPEYWQQQTSDKPLFKNLIWSQPENRQHAGKLAIFGGNLHGFAAPAEAYNISLQAGVGVVRVLLPDALKKIVGPIIAEGEYAPSTPSGSFSTKALGDMLPFASWADAVLLAGDFGRNSETAIVLEKFIDTFVGQLTITQDAMDYFVKLPSILERPNTSLVVSFSQLQKLAVQAKFTQAFTFDLGLLQLIERLHDFSQTHQAAIVVKHLDTIVVAINGQVSSTKLPTDTEIWRVKVAAYASVWQLQNPDKSFAAITTAIFKFIS